MIEFDNSVFGLGEHVHQLVQTSNGPCVVTENFYQNLPAARQQIEQLPFCKTIYGDSDMYDARGTFASTIPGNELPFFDQWSESMSSYLGTRLKSLHDPLTVQVNANKIQSPKHQEYFFNAHKDHGAMSTVIFLNDEYLKGDGFNIYRDIPEPPPTWVHRKDLSVEVFVQGRPNRAVTFFAARLHGMECKTPFFADHIRLTQAIFMKEV